MYALSIVYIPSILDLEDFEEILLIQVICEESIGELDPNKFLIE